MKLIPVVDLKGGVVVAAAGGERARYRRLSSPLCTSGRLEDAVAALLAFATEPEIYIADIDAIIGNGGNLDAIHDLCATRPDAKIWLDAGVGDVASAEIAGRPANSLVVVGSETLRGAGDLEAITNRFADRAALSLDFRGDKFLGPASVLANSSTWPQQVIVMTLAEVGHRRGPHLSRIKKIVDVAGDRQVLAAGGVRNVEDFKDLKRAGAAGALVATALHQGQIKTGDLEEIAGL